MKGATSSKSQWSPKRLARTSAPPPRGGLFWTWAPSGVCHVKNSDSGRRDFPDFLPELQEILQEKGFASGNRQCGAGGMYFFWYDMPCGFIFRLACGSFVTL